MAVARFYLLGMQYQRASSVQEQRRRGTNRLVSISVPEEDASLLPPLAFRTCEKGDSVNSR